MVVGVVGWVWEKTVQKYMVGEDLTYTNGVIAALLETYTSRPACIDVDPGIPTPSNIIKLAQTFD